MEKIKVHLTASNHPLYNELIRNPPENAEYQIKETKEIAAAHSAARKFAGQLVTKAYSALKMPRVFYIKTDRDMIHSSRGIMPLNRKPWVLDIEYASMFAMKPQDLKSAFSRGIIETMLASKYCKKVMPMTKIGARSILTSLDSEKFAEKVETVYPTIQPLKFPSKRNKGKTRLLFVGRRFYGKGGMETLEAFDILRKKYSNLELTMWCDDVPKEFLNKYSEVKFITNPLPRETLIKEHFCTSDIFVLPTYIDTYGFVFLEAMSCGLPIVSTDIFAVPELVEDGKWGLLAKSPIRQWDENGNDKYIGKRDEFQQLLVQKKPQMVKQIVDSLKKLIEDEKLRKKIGIEGQKAIEEGKFSIKARNKKLSEIYEAAVK